MSNKSEQIKLLSAYAAELLRKLSATEAMLAESQKEVAELQAGLDTLAGWNDAARVVGAVQNALATGMLTGEGE